MSRNLRRSAEAPPGPAANPTFSEVLLSRREVLKTGLGGVALAAFTGCAMFGSRPDIGFTAVPVSSDDLLRVPAVADTPVLEHHGLGRTLQQVCSKMYHLLAGLLQHSI